MEEGMGQSASPIPTADWPPPVDIQEHIQRCTCTCDHMGYGNYLDYQVRLFTAIQLLSFFGIRHSTAQTVGDGPSMLFFTSCSRNF